MHSTGRIVIVALLVMWANASHAAATYHVAPYGSDANPGTEQQPLKSLAKARDTVRSVNKAMTEDIVVYLHGKTFTLEEPLRLDGRDSGTGGHRVVYKAAEGQTPIISGGKAVRGWTKDGERRWKAAWSGGDSRQLYVNGVRAQRARGPAPEGMGRYGDLKFFDGDAGHTAPGEAMAEWRNQGDIELGYYNSWGHMICKVKSIARDGAGGVKIAMQQPWFTLCSRKEGVQIQLPAYIENAIELLDEPGEWYLDKPAKTIYYIPREGENMETASVVAPVLETLVELWGTLDEPVHDIRFEGISFADATWLSPNRIGHADEQANFTFAAANIFERDKHLVNVHNEYLKSPANVVLHAAKSIRFERCTFTRLGGAALDIESGSQENVVSGCHFHDISGSAVQIGDVLPSDHHPDDPRLIVQGNQVTNCLIERVGVEFQDSIGVYGGYVRDTLIAHNEIRDLPYSGVSVGWGWGEEDAGGGAYQVIPYLYSTPTPCGNNRIEYNHIHDVMLLRNDGGGIYTLGNQKGTVIRGNHIHDNNKGGGPGGIYLDEGSGFIEITGNAVYGVDTPMNYNNKAQNRIATCNEHANFFGAKPGEAGFQQSVADTAGLEAPYRDILR
jgi:hypothetical protein